MSFDLSDTAAAYCDASVGALKLHRGSSLLHTSWLQSQTQFRSACPSTQFTDTKEVQFFFLRYTRMETSACDFDKGLSKPSSTVWCYSNAFKCGCITTCKNTSMSRCTMLSTSHHNCHFLLSGRQLHILYTYKTSISSNIVNRFEAMKLYLRINVYHVHTMKTNMSLNIQMI